MSSNDPEVQIVSGPYAGLSGKLFEFKFPGDLTDTHFVRIPDERTERPIGGTRLIQVRYDEYIYPQYVYSVPPPIELDGMTRTHEVMKKRIEQGYYKVTLAETKPKWSSDQSEEQSQIWHQHFYMYKREEKDRLQWFIDDLLIAYGFDNGSLMTFGKRLFGHVWGDISKQEGAPPILDQLMKILNLFDKTVAELFVGFVVIPLAVFDHDTSEINDYPHFTARNIRSKEDDDD
jgi:kynurenine formamidase